MVAPTVEPVRAGPRRREPGWDVLRSGFVLLVMLYHSTFLGPTLHPELLPRRFSFDHQVGASMLLVISAYFACATLGRSDSSARYWWGRMARILPAFVVAVPLAWLVLRYVAPDDWGFPPVKELFDNWLMLGNWDTVTYPWLDPAYWTLPLQLMAFTAAAVLSATRWGSGVRLRILLWTMLLVPLILWPLRARPYEVADPPEWYRTIVDGFGFHRMHLFVAGIAIWLWSTGRLGNRHAAALLAVCGIAQFVHNLDAGPDGVVRIDLAHLDGTAAVLVCTGIALVALVARLPAVTDWIPASAATGFRWLAGISYGVYLVHQTVGYVLMRRLQDLGVGPLRQSAAMILTGLLLGWLLTRLVERPAHRALMRVWDRRTARAAAT